MNGPTKDAMVALRNDLDEYMAGEPLADDTTMLLVRRNS
jgi:hypothetical protein